MKKLIISALATVSMLNNAYALRVLTSEQITIENHDGEVARAYRDMESCRSWYWMPRIYKHIQMPALS